MPHKSNCMRGLNDLVTTDEIQSVDFDKAKSTGEEWSRLAQMVQKIATNLEEGSLLEAVMDYAIEITNAERGFLALLDDYGELDIRVAKGMDGQEINDARAAVSSSVIGKVIQERHPVLENDIQGNSTLENKQSLTRLGIHSVMGVPMIAKDHLIGVAYVDSCSIQRSFTQKELTYLEAFIRLAAIAVENAQLFKNLSQTNQNYATLREYHERILRGLPLGEIVMKKDGTVEYLNEYAKSLWDLGPGEGNGQHFELFFSEENEVRQQVHQLWNRYLNGEKEVTQEITISDKTYQVSFFDILWWGRERDQSGMLIMDITLHKRIEDELVDEDKRTMVIQLAGGIAHEVNNLLATILGRTELLQFRIGQLAKELAKNVGGDFKVIFNQAKKLQKIVEDLRRLSKPSDPELVPTDLGSCMESAADILLNSSGKLKRFKRDEPKATYCLEVDIEPQIPSVIGDSQSLEQMFMNLILNAADALKAKKCGKITLKAFQEDGHLVSKVEDTGVGIPQDIIDRVFEPYFTTKGPKHGTGLGMSIVRRIADIHQASVSLTSQEGKGTTVTIAFPLARSEPNSIIKTLQHEITNLDT
jgi:two-component system NtrC family sensor kinase